MVKTRIKELRVKKGIAQADIAAELDINQNTFSRYENGIREPNLDTLIKIADYFEVSVDYILCRTDNPMVNK